MRSTSIKALGALLLGIVGWLLAAGAAHLYTDHQNLHALVTLVQQSQQAPKP